MVTQFVSKVGLLFDQLKRYLGLLVIREAHAPLRIEKHRPVFLSRRHRQILNLVIDRRWQIHTPPRANRRKPLLFYALIYAIQKHFLKVFLLLDPLTAVRGQEWQLFAVGGVGGEKVF